MVWLAHQPSPRRLGHIGKLHAVNPPILIHTYGHTRNSNTHKLMDKLTAPTTPPPILLGTGPWIGDMWLGKMRHDAGLSVRQILCLSACLQITSLERLTKTEKEFCFLPFWSPQSACSQPRSASGHCCLFFWHYLSFMAVAGCRNKFLFYSWCCFCVYFLQKIYQRAAEVCRCLNHFTVYPSALATPDKYVPIVTPHQWFFCLVKYWSPQLNNSSPSLKDLNLEIKLFLEAFSFRKRSDVVFIYFAQTGAVGETQSESPQCHRKESRRAHWLNALYYYWGFQSTKSLSSKRKKH